MAIPVKKLKAGMKVNQKKIAKASKPSNIKLTFGDIRK